MLYFLYIILLLVQTDRAAMLDEIVDYVKFLRLQVKVSSLIFIMVDGSTTFEGYCYLFNRNYIEL